MLIQAGSTVCFMLSDVSTVWVQGHIFDRDLPDRPRRRPVEETNPASDRIFHGTVNYVGAFVDPATRTTPVRIVTQNPEGLLKKDMFVEAVIHTGFAIEHAGRARGGRAARRQERADRLRPGASPASSRSVPSPSGTQQDGMIAISSGLQKGESVLADGSLFVQFANSIQ